MLARLSVFRGGFDRAAALAVTGSGLRTLSTLADLADRARPGGPLDLHEVIREYAAEAPRGDQAEEGEGRRLHAAHFAALASGPAPSCTVRSRPSGLASGTRTG